MDAPERGGVIDSVAAGFRITNRHLPFLLIPAALDLFLWLGPKVSVRPLLEAVLGSPSASLEELGATAAPSAASLSGFNLLGILAVAMPTSRSIFLTPTEDSAAVTIATWPAALAAVAVLFSAAVLIGALYRSAVVQGVLRPASWTGDDIYRTFVEAAPRYVRLLLLVLGVGVAGTAAAAVAVSLIDAVIPGGGSVAAVLLAGFVLWLIILFYLSDSAVFVSGHGAFASLGASARIVRLFLWPSVGLYFLLRLIGLGMGIIWGLVGDASVLAIAAIGGNAYVATGLTLAAMVYYRDRTESMRWNP